MQVCRTIKDIRSTVATLRKSAKRVGFVPTMGALHEGHLHLVRAAARATDGVVVSIFVNPTQFGPNEDFDDYPRDLVRDLVQLGAENVAAVFIPEGKEMYPEAPQTIVSVPSLANLMQGKLRPGHFDGVATVVAKLLNIVEPDLAMFGEKDFQQLAIIRRMVRDLNLSVEIRGHPIVREADGLAMSSRNVLLSPQDRIAARVLSRALDRVEGCALSNPHITAQECADEVRAVLLEESRAEIGSVDVLDAQTLTPLTGMLSRDTVILLAVRFASVLLIDNRVLPRKG